MLIEIRCEKLRVGSIEFHSSLNVVLGDANATNSIGKSTLLMIVDFAFGGDSLLIHNTDLVEELGHHDYSFSFNFDDEVVRFQRGTFQSDLVYRCDEDFQPSSPITIEKFRVFLKQAYKIENEDLSFRSLVSLYSRVWGKDNLNVRKPLHIVSNQAGKECVDNLIKTFDRYGPIRDLAARLKKKEEEKKALNAAFKNQILPKIGKRKRKVNEERINEIEAEIEDIKANLGRYAANISEIVSREVLELKSQKDTLLAVKLDLEGKLARTRRNLAGNRHIKSRHFDGLTRFFPEVDTQRLASIEEFHNGVARLLKAELQESAQNLNENLSRVESEILDIDRKMAEVVTSVDEPAVIVDRVHDLSASLQEASQENLYFESAETLRNETKGLKKDLSATKAQELALLERTLNDTMRRTVTSISSPDRKSPEITLKEGGYSFEVFEDTGTGTAYASLVILDLAVFHLTALPFVAHDSLLFKNIENDSAAGLFGYYLSLEKQSFVAIDEIEKYGAEASRMLRDQSVVELDNDHVLFVKDWRE